MLSIIIPTLNEVDNILENISQLESILSDIDHEIIFVDDNSSDGTYELCQNIGLSNPRIRSILRTSRRGLSSAILEGMLSSRYQTVCVVDADLQYDLKPIKDAFLESENGSDLVVLSRDMIDKHVASSLPNHRKKMTRLSTYFMKKIIPYSLSDPSSGFFVIKKDLIVNNINSITGIGWKLLLDILLSVKGMKIAEVTTSFNMRSIGKSKINISVFIDLFEMLLNKFLRSNTLGSFILYALSGLVGIVILLLLQIFFLQHQSNYMPPLFFASLLSIFPNYFINNIVTFRATRIRGPFLSKHLFKYFLICSIGFFINISILENLGGVSVPNLLVSTFIAGVWNFFLSRWLVWKVN